MHDKTNCSMCERERRRLAYKVLERKAEELDCTEMMVYIPQEEDSWLDMLRRFIHIVQKLLDI